MKVLKRINLTVIMAVFFMAGPCLSQNTAEQIWTLGVEYVAKGDFNIAKTEFAKVLRVDPLFEAADRYLKIIVSMNQQKTNTKLISFYFKGVDYNLKGQWDDAIVAFNSALIINPGYAMAYYNRGIVFANQGQFDKAISDFNKAIEIEPNSAPAYNNRGPAYSEGKDQYDKAISDFNKCIQINPRDGDAYYNRGLAYFNKGKYNKAISDASLAIKINPGHGVAYHLRALSYQHEGQDEKACSDLKRACELGVDVCDSYNMFL